MQRLHHLLDLADAHGPVIRIRGVRSFRNVVIDGIVTPVVSAADRFVDGTEIVDRHQLHRGNAKLFEIRQSRRKIRMTAQRRSQVGERKIFSTMGFGESSRGIVAEIADMRFPNNRLRNWHFRHAIGIPTFGIGARQVDDHASTAVHASRVRPWIQRDRTSETAVATTVGQQSYPLSNTLQTIGKQKKHFHYLTSIK